MAVDAALGNDGTLPRDERDQAPELLAVGFALPNPQFCGVRATIEKAWMSVVASKCYAFSVASGKTFLMGPFFQSILGSPSTLHQSGSAVGPHDSLGSAVVQSTDFAEFLTGALVPCSTA